MTGQLVLDLPFRPALGRDDFLVAPSNAAAVALIDQWPKWPSHGAMLVGPHGSGKSHLGHVWQVRTGARLVEAAAVSREGVPGLLEQGALIVENMDAGELDEAALFHVLNLAKAGGGHILFTSVLPPSRMPVRLPDLLSRLRALPVATIEAPDDALLRGVLVKHFSDRQIAVDEPLISFILARMPRSLDMARTVVAALDAAALQQKTRVTRAFAGTILSQLLEPELP